MSLEENKINPGQEVFNTIKVGVITIIVFIMCVLIITAFEVNFYIGLVSLIGPIYTCLLLIKLKKNEKLDAENKILDAENKILDAENKIVELEIKLRNSILTPFNERYLTIAEKNEHISDLMNLIIHELDIYLSESDVVLILNENIKQNEIKKFGKEIGNIGEITSYNIAKYLIDTVGCLNSSDNKEYLNKLDFLCEYFDRKNIKYDNNDILGYLKVILNRR